MARPAPDASGRRAFVAALLAVAAVAAAPASAASVVIAGTTFRFATIAQAREILGREDDWTAATSDFQRRAVTGSDVAVSRSSFAAFNADRARAWREDDEARWTRALTAIAPRLSVLRPPLPRDVWLVDSDGRESAGYPYTRFNAIVLPQDGLRRTPAGLSDEELLAHEIFHVVSRHSPDLATRLYALIGYKPVPPFEWPAAWLPLRIANPDAPSDRHAMRIESRGRTMLVMPVLVARRADLRPGESMFSVLDVRLIEAAPAADGSRTLAVMRGGEPVWQPASGAGEFLARLGGNTRYVMHPEETIADNFAFLVSGRSVAYPKLLERIAGVLRSQR